MTRNQIDYMKHKEEQRHNRAVERETRRTNKQNENIKRVANDQTYDLGLAKNQISISELDEVRRANLAREREQNRTNIENERLKGQQIAIDAGISSRNVAELERANRAREIEANRSNVASENIRREANQISNIGANAAMGQVGAAYANVNARLAELGALTNYRKDQIQLGYDQLGETSTHNRATEQVASGQLDVSQSQIGINQQNADTQQRMADIAAINAATNRSQLGVAQARNAIAADTLTESARHNRAEEWIKVGGLAVDLFN